MAVESRNWIIFVATTWIQAFTGTNFDFSSYSTDLKSVLGISQMQLNYVSVASDMGKAFGWCSGVCLMYLPIWSVMFIAGFMGFVGYGLQWLVIQKIIILPYYVVLMLSLLAGCSICWFNTVCYVLCIRNFPSNRSLALSLSVSFNGVSAALYHLIANSINPTDNKLYLLLNSLIPLLISFTTLLPITMHSPQETDIHQESSNFLFHTILSIITGLYLLFLSSVSSKVSITSLVLYGAMFLLVLPLAIPSLVKNRENAQKDKNPSFEMQGWSFSLIENDEFEAAKEIIEIETRTPNDFLNNSKQYHIIEDFSSNVSSFKDQIMMLGEEHSIRMLVNRLDFWLYYVAYFCGGTIGLVFSNNLGQITESLGFDSSEVSSLVSIYSTCSFFGRLLSTTPDFVQEKLYFARTGWFALALVPTPFAFLLLVVSGSKIALMTATSMIGLSSGFVFSAAVSITPELFGPNTAGVNHNILITNIPIGSLLYSLLAALVYESNILNSNMEMLRDGSSMVCVGRNCYHMTFVCWWFISLIGLISSSLLFLRTKDAYGRARKRNIGQI